MSYPKDELGAWIRPMEQRFRALAAGAISVRQFLNVGGCRVFEERAGDDWLVVYVDPSLQLSEESRLTRSLYPDFLCPTDPDWEERILDTADWEGVGFRLPPWATGI